MIEIIDIIPLWQVYVRVGNRKNFKDIIYVVRYLRRLDPSAQCLTSVLLNDRSFLFDKRFWQRVAQLRKEGTAQLDEFVIQFYFSCQKRVDGLFGHKVKGYSFDDILPTISA